MEMTHIKKCDMLNCAYNTNLMCHTMGINVGAHSECNTYNHGSSKGGFLEIHGGVGACLASGCRFNDHWECKATNIDVFKHDSHADCETFQARA